MLGDWEKGGWLWGGKKQGMTNQILAPAAAPGGGERCDWRRIAPGRGAETVTRRSVMWTVPVELGVPSWRIGCGLDAEEKWSPEAEMVLKTSPVRWEPGGTRMVVVVR